MDLAERRRRDRKKSCRHSNDVGGRVRIVDIPCSITYFRRIEDKFRSRAVCLPYSEARDSVSTLPSYSIYI